MIHDAVDPLSAEPLLAEMLRQNRRRHFFEISHLIYRNSTADNFFHIRIRNIRNIPHFVTVFFHFITLIHPGDDFLGMSQKAHKFLKCLTLL